MKMTLSENSQTSTELHVGSLFNPITQSNGNSQPPRYSDLN